MSKMELSKFRRENPRGLESLPEFKEGAHSDLLPHRWFYFIARDHELIRNCFVPIAGINYTDGCNQETTIMNDVNETDFEFIKLEFPQLFIEESGYCKSRSIATAKKKGTFNPEYKEGVSD